MSIEQLKKKLESEREDLQHLFTKFDSDRYVEFVEKYPKLWCDIYDIEENSRYHRAIINSMLAGHEAATNRLLPLLEKAVDEIKYIKRHSKRCNECGAHDIAEDFLSDFVKMTEIKKEFGE